MSVGRRQWRISTKLMYLKNQRLTNHKNGSDKRHELTDGLNLRMPAAMQVKPQRTLRAKGANQQREVEQEETQSLHQGGGTRREESRRKGLQESPLNSQNAGMTTSQEVCSSEKRPNLLIRPFPSPLPHRGTAVSHLSFPGSCDITLSPEEVPASLTGPTGHPVWAPLFFSVSIS